MDEVLDKYFKELEDEGFDFTISDADKKYINDTHERSYKQNYPKPPEMDEKYRYNSDDDFSVSTPGGSPSDDDDEEVVDEVVDIDIPIQSVSKINLDEDDLEDNITSDDNQSTTDILKPKTTSNPDKVFDAPDPTRNKEYDKMLAQDEDLQKAYIEKLLTTAIGITGVPMVELIKLYISSGIIDDVDFDCIGEVEGDGGSLDLGIKDDENKKLYIYTLSLKVFEPNYKIVIPENLVRGHEQVSKNMIPSLLKMAVFLFNYIKSSNPSLGGKILCPMQNDNDYPILIIVDEDVSKYTEAPYLTAPGALGINVGEAIKTYAQLEEESKITSKDAEPKNEG